MQDFLRFLVVSGCGWVIDIALTVLLVQVGLSPFVAATFGAATAVTFVYVVSLSAVFEVDGSRDASAFGLYVVWQVIAISAASILVAALAFVLKPSMADLLNSRFAHQMGALPDSLSIASGVAKVLVTPLTLVANFLFMKWLTGRMRATESLKN